MESREKNINMVRFSKATMFRWEECHLIHCNRKEGSFRTRSVYVQKIEI